MENDVLFECVNSGRKLRIRIISPGYNKRANCQFPKDIRSPGRKYAAPASSIKFARGSNGKFFYRVSKKFIRILDDAEDVSSEVKVSVNKVFEDDNPICVICFDLERDVVIVPCGHYCLCKKCASTIIKSTSKCPMCRSNMELVVTRENIQTDE